jgi:hypothetical protein
MFLSPYRLPDTHRTHLFVNRQFVRSTHVFTNIPDIHGIHRAQTCMTVCKQLYHIVHGIQSSVVKVLLSKFYCRSSRQSSRQSSSCQSSGFQSSGCQSSAVKVLVAFFPIMYYHSLCAFENVSSDTKTDAAGLNRTSCSSCNVRPSLNWIEHLTTDQKVGDSNSPGRASENR